MLGFIEVKPVKGTTKYRIQKGSVKRNCLTAHNVCVGDNNGATITISCKNSYSEQSTKKMHKILNVRLEGKWEKRRGERTALRAIVHTNSRTKGNDTFRLLLYYYGCWIVGAPWEWKNRTLFLVFFSFLSELEVILVLSFSQRELSPSFHCNTIECRNSMRNTKWIHQWICWHSKD